MTYAAFLTTEAAHEDEVEINGSRHKVWFREVSHVVYARFIRESQSTDVDERDAAAARLVAGSLCNPDGSLAFERPEEVCRLKSDVVNAMVPLIVKASRVSDAAKKASPPEA